MTRNIIPPTEWVRQTFDYDPETGSLKWKARPREEFTDHKRWKQFMSTKIGQEAGCVQVDYGSPVNIKIKFRISGVLYQLNAHNLIFRWMGVEIPEGMIVDHKDNDPTNNRWRNLRLSDWFGNAHNKPVARRNKTTPFPKGVFPRKKGTFAAILKHRYTTYRMGPFPSMEEAKEAYDRKAQELHGEFFHGFKKQDPAPAN